MGCGLHGAAEQQRQAIGRLQHVERGFRCAAGRGDLLAQGRRVCAGFEHQRAGAGDGAPRQAPRGFSVEAFVLRSGGEHFGEQEHVSRARAGDRGDYVHQPFVRDRLDHAERFEQQSGEFLIGRRGAGAGDVSGDPLPDLAWRVGHGADDALGAEDIRQGADSDAGHDRQHKRVRPDEGLCIRRCSFENLRFDCDDDDIGRARFGRVEFGAGGGEFSFQHGVKIRLAHRER